LRTFISADLKRYSAMSVQYSRGCPFQLRILRHHRNLWARARTKSNQQMLAELDALRDLGWRGSVLLSMIIHGNKKNVRQFLPGADALAGRKRLPVFCYLPNEREFADDEELLGNMQRAGFDASFSE